MKNFNKKFNWVRVSAGLLAGIFFSLHGFSQTTSNTQSRYKKSNATNPDSVESAPNPDPLKTENREAGKPFVLGDDGQKVFFLSDPYKISLKADEKLNDAPGAKKKSPGENKLQEPDRPEK